MPVAPEDHVAILDLLARYNHTLDRYDRDGWAELFAPDGVYLGPGYSYHGRGELRQCMADYEKSQAAALGDGDRGLHWNTNIIVDGDAGGDTARTEAYIMVVLLLDGELKIQSQGRYRDELVKLDEGWRFTRREVYDLLPDGVARWALEAKKGS